jgi:tetratricopeptide (TPR) repeat protein
VGWTVCDERIAAVGGVQPRVGQLSGGPRDQCPDVVHKFCRAVPVARTGAPRAILGGNLSLRPEGLRERGKEFPGQAALPEHQLRPSGADDGWKDARDHFTALVNDNGCPPNLAAEAFFALGDTITRQDADPAKPAGKFDEAKEAFSKIPLLYPTNRLVPRAWGRIGDCYFQMAALDAKHYDSATNAYRKVLDSPASDVGARYQALIGLGQVLERQAQARPAPESAALLKGAFDHYYDIVSDAKLRDGEKPDPFWFKEAGFAAARLAEEQTRWDVAISIYRRMSDVLAPLRPTLEKKIEKAREHLRPEKG